jgi:lycopene cyclase domain-containing protein
MKYSRFLLVFIAPVVVIFGILALPRMTKREWFAVVTLPILAVVWTTPWDNYLVASGVWRYNPQKVWNVILGHVPLEEYLFFVLQTWAVTFPAILVLRKMNQGPMSQEEC